MAQVTTSTTVDDDDASAKEHTTRQDAEEVVIDEQDKLRIFVDGLTSDDLKSGNWFIKLISHALSTYATKVDWSYFQHKYAGVPADAIAEQRIKMAARYAALEGGLSAGAYTATVAATIGSLGAASPATVPAAVATMLVDVAFTTQLQLRLAYDIAVLYRVPLDLHDPEDLWKLVRVAFNIRSGEVLREGVVKGVPVLVRPLVRRFYRGAAIGVGRSLPVVGRHLLQTNMIKVGIPLVGVPLATLLNRYTTLVAGQHARSVFRAEARLVELADRLSARSRHPKSLLWVAWLVMSADGKISDDEAVLMRHLVVAVRRDHDVVDEVFSRLVDVRSDEVWSRLTTEEGVLDDLVEAAVMVAECDGPTSSRERALLEKLGERCTARE